MGGAFVATLAGCDLFGGSDPSAAGTFAFSNAYGYVETIVVRPDYSSHQRFEVQGLVTIQDDDGTLTGTGTCTKTTIIQEEPGSVQTRSETVGEVSFSGVRSRDRLSAVRLTGCAYPRAMAGRIERGRLVLNTELDFPVSRGTTVIADRFGDPSQLVLTRSE